MKTQKLFFMLCLLFLFTAPLQAIENQQEFSNREKIRKIVIGPVMGFGVAATTAYCAKKMGWGSSPLAMLGCLVAYRVLHGLVARKGEHYNKWHVIPAMLVGYGCGYYIACPSAAVSFSHGEHVEQRVKDPIVKCESALDLSQDPNLRPVALRGLDGNRYTVYVPENATWADAKKAFVDAYRHNDFLYDDGQPAPTSINAKRLVFIGAAKNGKGTKLSDNSAIFNPTEGEFDYKKVKVIHLIFINLPAGTI